MEDLCQNLLSSDMDKENMSSENKPINILQQRNQQSKNYLSNEVNANENMDWLNKVKCQVLSLNEFKTYSNLYIFNIIINTACRLQI